MLKQLSKGIKVNQRIINKIVNENRFHKAGHEFKPKRILLRDNELHPEGNLNQLISLQRMPLSRIRHRRQQIHRPSHHHATRPRQPHHLERLNQMNNKLI